jgi:nucleotide-binding universal stress UspA family protein
MSGLSDFPVLVCTDGSPQARAAVEAATGFPWPARATVTLVVARGGLSSARRDHVTRDPEEVSLAVAELALKTLGRRWSGAVPAFPAAEPVRGILEEARTRQVRAIVLGSRGLGTLRRLMLGSVSRGVLRAATCPVLVIRGRLRKARRFVLGVDGSTDSQRAVNFLASLAPPTSGHVTVVHVLEPARVPTRGLMPVRVRAKLRAIAGEVEAEQQRAGQGLVDGARDVLRAAGWMVEPMLMTGNPLERLLGTAERRTANVVVVGARGTGGVEHLLLGSVAEGVIARSPVSVLIVR